MQEKIEKKKKLKKENKIKTKKFRQNFGFTSSTFTMQIKYTGIL